MAAEIGVQLKRPRPRLAGHLPLVLQVHVHIGPLEPIDGLLGIAHRAKVGEAGAAQQPDEVYLQLVGVLELVHHDQLEPLLQLLPQERPVAQGPIGKTEDVGGIDAARLLLERPVFFLHAARRGEEVFSCRFVAAQNALHDQSGKRSLQGAHRLFRLSLGARQSEARQCGDHLPVRQGGAALQQPSHLPQRLFGLLHLPRRSASGQEFLQGRSRLPQDSRRGNGGGAEIEGVQPGG